MRRGDVWVGVKLAERYEILDEVGRGGRGVVYRARDPRLDREVAVKILPPSEVDEENVARFRLEARLVGQMDHPSIVPIHDLGRHGDTFFFVMPLLRGETLRQRLQRGPLPVALALEIAAAIAEALDHSHGHGVVHRDIKPENVMLEHDTPPSSSGQSTPGGRGGPGERAEPGQADGDAHASAAGEAGTQPPSQPPSPAEGAGREEPVPRVRVMDFGLARDDRSRRITHSGNLPGTLAYLSPEQVLSSGDLDGRSDLYALGVVLYECLTGVTPFDGPVFGVLYSIVHETPASLAERGVRVAPAIEQLVLACLAKDPLERPATGRGLAEALRGLAQHARRADRGAEPRASANAVADAVVDPGIETGATDDGSSSRTAVSRVSAGRAVSRVSAGRAVSGAGREAVPGVREPAVSLSGRGAEMARVRDRLTWADTGEAQLVLLAGEAGLGKSRILREIGKIARRRGAVVLLGRGVARQVRAPFQLLGDALLDHFLASDDSAQRLAAADLADLVPSLVDVFPQLAVLTEGVVTQGPVTEGPVTEGPVPLANEAPAPSSDALPSSAALPSSDLGPSSAPSVATPPAWSAPELVARALDRIAGDRTLVLLLDGLHVDEATASAVGYLVRRLASRSLLVLGAYRPSEVERGSAIDRLIGELRGDRFFLHLELGPVSEEEFPGLLADLLGTDRVDRAIATTLFRATEGNPLFAESLVGTLLESGRLSRTPDGGFRLAADVTALRRALPATLRRAAEDRLERLPSELRQALEIASVLGRSFDFDDLETLWSASEAEGSERGRSVDELDDRVDRLVDKGVLEEDLRRRGDRLSFASAVLRDQTYRGMSRRRRRTLHRRFAEALEERHRGRLDRVYARLVHHFARADAGPQTVRYGLALARASLDTRQLGMHGAGEAVEAAATALELVDADGVDDGDRAEAELLALMARAYFDLAETERAAKRAAEALELYERLGDRRGAVAMLTLAAEASWRDRQIDRARRWVDRGLSAARQALRDAEEQSGRETDPADLGTARDRLGRLLELGSMLANLRGEHDRAAAWDEESRGLAAPAEGGIPEPAVPEGGELTTAVPATIPELVPGNLETDEAVEIAANIFETLLGTDAEGRVRPRLCRSFRLVDEGQCLVLELRDDVRFSDGTPLTAEGAVRSLIDSAEQGRENLAPGFFSAIEGMDSYLEGRATEVSGLRVTSELGFEIRSTRPLAMFPALLTDQRAAIARPARTAGEEPGQGSPPAAFLGTGPFRVEARELEEDGRGRFVLGPNPHSRRPPRLRRLTFRTGLPAAENAHAFFEDRVQIARDLTAGDLESLAADPEIGARVVEVTRKNTWFVLAHRRGLLAREPLLRRTLSWVLVSHDLVWRTLGRFAEPAMGLIPPGVFGHDPGRRRDHLGLEDARRQLHSEGLRGPFRLRAAIHPVLLDRYGALFRALLDRWGQLGVQVESVTPDRASFLASYRSDEGFDLMFNRWNPDYDDPDNFTYNLLHGAGGILGRWAGHAEADRWMEEARAELDVGARLGLYRQLEDWLAVRAWLVPLFHEMDTRVASARVRGLKLRSTYPYVSYDRLGLEPASARSARADSAATVTLSKGPLSTGPLSTGPLSTSQAAGLDGVAAMPPSPPVVAISAVVPAAAPDGEKAAFASAVEGSTPSVSPLPSSPSSTSPSPASSRPGSGSEPFSSPKQPVPESGRSEIPAPSGAKSGMPGEAPFLGTTGHLQRGGEISAAVAASFLDLDPARAVLSDRLEVTSTIFETLMRVDNRARVVPSLLSAVSVDSSGRVYSLRLRQGVRFHDGRRLSSRDVRYSFERLLRSGNPEVQWILAGIVGADWVIAGKETALAGLEVLTALELRIELEKPAPFFPALLTHPATAILPEGIEAFGSPHTGRSGLEAGPRAPVDRPAPPTLRGPWRSGCVGTGPFRVTYFEPGRRVELEPHPDYRRPGRPKADRLSFDLGLGVDEVVRRFRDGRLSLAGDLSPEALESLRRDPDLGAVYREAPRLASYFLLLETRRGPFADLAVRRAFRTALLRGSGLDLALGRQGSRASGLFPPGVLGHRAPDAPASDLSGGLVGGENARFDATTGRVETPGLLAGLELRAVLHPAYEGAYRTLWSTLVETLGESGVRIASETPERDGAREGDPAGSGSGHGGPTPELVPVGNTSSAANRGRGSGTWQYRSASSRAFDLAAVRWIADYPDADAFVTGLDYFVRRGLLDRESTQTLRELGDRAGREVDPAVRQGLYRRFEEQMAHDAVVVPLFHEQIYRLSRPEVQGVRLGLSFPEVDYEEVWVDERRPARRWPTFSDA